METMERLFQSNFKVGAYPFYEYLRQHDPIFLMSQQHNQSSWIVTKYDHVKELLKTQSFLKDQSKLFSTSPHDTPQDEMTTIFQNMMLDVDPPDHTRLRKLVQPYFNPKTIKNLQPRIEDIADQLIMEMNNKKGPIDLINDFAFPLPIIVISELLGVPAEDRNKFRRWSNTILAAADDMETDFVEDVQAFTQYLTRLFEERREEPQDDLISNLLQAEEEGEQLSRTELYSMIVLLIIAGHETTVNLIANTMYALFEHPRQMERLREDFSWTENAIEEGLRYYSPVDFSTARWAEKDMEFHGKHIQRGDLVLASLSSANRDESKFERADEFDITRKEVQHVAFGFGIHFCLGAPLARLEGKIALEKLLNAFPDIRLAEQKPNWRPVFLLRGLDNLYVNIK
ncbi:cytochrome P450 family protein [Pontibacillus yanchengensis]|uniref:Cytochrome P450 n=1 Tax=Pontibacillus yanchengensis Y32 TaxID=1385514 RepID=A0A0A2TA43_9BACI|nr:cytochrome P450 [Pontibacillus yanchengensis]KGP72394.1 cytochrome P450 [Pontibacillus yanchengensis Y32]